VQLAIPRRTYTRSRIDYVIESWVAKQARVLPGLRIVSQPRQRRLCTAQFVPLR
jgi:tryptophanase